MIQLINNGDIYNMGTIRLDDKTIIRTISNEITQYDTAGVNNFGMHKIYYTKNANFKYGYIIHKSSSDCAVIIYKCCDGKYIILFVNYHIKTKGIVNRKEYIDKYNIIRILVKN